MSDETQVTFVGGKAAEQTTSGESATPPDERAAAIEAVKKALQSEGEAAAEEAKESVRKSRKASGFEEDEPAEEKSEPKAEKKEAKPGRDENGRFLPKGDDDKEKPEDGKEDLSLKRVLTERKQIAQYKQQQSHAIQEQMRQLQETQRQIQEQARMLQAERERILALRSDPGRIIREIGYDPEEFILDLAREGTPEGQAMRKQREQERLLKEMADWRKQQEEQRVQAQRRYEEQKAAAFRSHVEREFVNVATSEKFPYLSNFYKGREQMLIAQGDIIADQYKELTGNDATFEDIAEYLESEMAERYNAYGKASGNQVPAAVTKVRSTQGATGRTLSPDVSSERRSLGVNLKDLDGDERLAAAREAVGAALRASGQKT